MGELSTIAGQVIRATGKVDTPSKLGFARWDGLGEHSLADLFTLLSEKEKVDFLVRIALEAKVRLDEVLMLLKYEWRGFWARRKQLPPGGNWTWWLVMAGRGFGKTRTGAQWIIERAWQGKGPIALIGHTAKDVRNVMVYGPGGIMANSPPWFKPKHDASKATLTWPNGVRAMTFSGDYPDQLRGPENWTAWVDEVAKLRYPGWDGMGRSGTRGAHGGLLDNLAMGMRVGHDPRVLLTSTPRNLPLFHKAIANPKCVVVRGATMENNNLPAEFVAEVIRTYKGTTLGDQELLGALIEDNPNALWTKKDIYPYRTYERIYCDTIVVGVDPSGSESGNVCGIVVVGRKRINGVDHFFVLDDMSIGGHPDVWSAQVASAYNKYEANMVVAEANYGGKMVESTLRVKERRIPVKIVHATKSKRLRAEPVSVLYRNGEVHHVGVHANLETEMTTWEPGMASPNLIDALVWAITYLEERSSKSRVGSANKVNRFGRQ